MITKPNLQTNKPIGNGINAPVYQSGPTNLITTKSASMNGGHCSTTASTVNLSAKYKNPQNKQDTGIMYTGQK